MSLTSPSLPAALTLVCLSLAGLSAAEYVPIQPRTGFANLHHRCSVDRKARVAFLGGSITQNGSGHVAMIPEWLKSQYPEAEITVLNAGLSSTCSVTGAFRVGAEVLDKGPVDLFVVEFAVNDDQDAAHDHTTALRGMEGIIRQVRARYPAADILMVHYVNPDLLAKVTAGEVPVSIGAHEAVAAHWGITSVNVNAALAASTKAGGMNWDSYGGVHPNLAGYRFASDIMIRALGEKGAAAPGIVEHPAPEAPLDAASFGKISLIDLQQVSWLGGWKFGPVSQELLPLGAIRGDFRDRPLLRADAPGSTLYVDFIGRALTAFVLAGPDSGTLEVSVDGGEWRPVTLFHAFSKGLNYPRSVVLAQGLASGFHQVALRTSDQKPEGSEGTSASILQLGSSD